MKWMELVRKRIELKFILGLVLMVSVLSVSNYLTISGESDAKLLEDSSKVSQVREDQAKDGENQSLEEETQDKPGFYENIVTVADGDATLVLVNKNYALDSNYEPYDLVLPNVLTVGGNRNQSILFGETNEGIWLKENAHRFGFIIRYLEGRESETGYQYEPWHLRYVGTEAATEIYENNWILEQYLNQ